MVRRLATFLTCIAVSETHTPHQYATFLRFLLQSHGDHIDIPPTHTPEQDRQPEPNSTTSAAHPSNNNNAPEQAAPLPNTSTNDRSRGAIPSSDRYSQPNPNQTPSSPRLTYSAAAQLLMGLPLMPGGREDNVTCVQGPTTDHNAWQHHLQINTDQLNDCYWSSLLPPGFGNLHDFPNGTPSTNLFAPPTANSGHRWSTTCGSAGQQSVDDTRSMGSMACSNTMQPTSSATPQNWFSFPPSTQPAPGLDGPSMFVHHNFASSSTNPPISTSEHDTFRLNSRV